MPDLGLLYDVQHPFHALSHAVRIQAHNRLLTRPERPPTACSSLPIRSFLGRRSDKTDIVEIRVKWIDSCVVHLG